MNPAQKTVDIYTDGSCLHNPGPGGYGVVMLFGDHRKELSGGVRRTTNNRMEMMAAIVGLQALQEPCQVTLYTDSQYVVNAMTKGWAKRWRAQGWMRNKKDKAVNPDLWTQLLDLCDRHRVDFRWVRGHAGNVENERCDRLAVQAAKQSDLPPDEGYQP
ncbi:ribonuclease HI [Prochlorothrix hollandica]|uniref:Ribonuclease H n=1 Tax=Prochlorothrix hollandica PCC 9006 = CALU 1027 TaxID=317619 RepID=A0A0M2Q1R4_PROHO|nr:ribonuclease HI [Prochlorothrix hollandica]KKJ00894.1 ribonuclease H [Prochlorothrix hollandica PCC 9006 = CALU 1027]